MHAESEENQIFSSIITFFPAQNWHRSCPSLFKFIFFHAKTLHRHISQTRLIRNQEPFNGLVCHNHSVCQKSRDFIGATYLAHIHISPDSKVHGANIWPTWVLSALGGLHVGPMNLVFKEVTAVTFFSCAPVQLPANSAHTYPDAYQQDFAMARSAAVKALLAISIFDQHKRMFWGQNPWGYLNP